MTLQYVADLIASPDLQSFVLGLFVPTALKALKEQFAVEPSGRVKFLMNVGLCLAFSFVPLGISWAVNGFPDAATVGGALTAAALASQARYNLFTKPKQEATGA